MLRLLHTWDEFVAAEDLQRVVWQMPNWRDVVPANLLVTVAKNGGCVLGAFDSSQNDRLVGLAFSFIGMDAHLAPPVLKHCSHMLAVLPEYQSRKLGVRLKLEQRAFALAQQIGLMTWTYDPLLALNANLNIARLGAIARRYVPDAYGAMTDGLNAGLASDRFEVEWWLDTPRVRDHTMRKNARAEWDALVHQGGCCVFELARDDHGLPRIVGENEMKGELLLVEIPVDLGALKVAAPEQARSWRVHTRDLFQRAFAAGYAVTDFVLASHAPIPRAAYVLTPAGLGHLPAS